MRALFGLIINVNKDSTFKPKGQDQGLQFCPEGQPRTKAKNTIPVYSAYSFRF